MSTIVSIFTAAIGDKSKVWILAEPSLKCLHKQFLMILQSKLKQLVLAENFVHHKILFFGINKKTFPAIGTRLPVIRRYSTVSVLME
ncbi:MAG TPA: hypothetical protein VN726_08360 [Hanamia sp.]|jgi:hypothetical protein|nr:hypothetical protein [Hanamia sp.]